MMDATNSRAVDYDKAYESMRFFQEYLLKVFNFSVVINGAVLTVILSSSSWGLRLGLAIFAFVENLVVLLIHLRIHSATLIYRELLMEAEIGMNLATFARLRDHPGHRGFRLGILFRVLYALIVIAWLIGVVSLALAKDV